jgi:hypothetical protein
MPTVLRFARIIQSWTGSASRQTLYGIFSKNLELTVYKHITSTFSIDNTGGMDVQCPSARQG